VARPEFRFPGVSLAMMSRTQWQRPAIIRLLPHARIVVVFDRADAKVMRLDVNVVVTDQACMRRNPR
jgi:hypothetical protein